MELFICAVKKNGEPTPLLHYNQVHSLRAYVFIQQVVRAGGEKNAIKQFGDSLLNLASPFDQRDAAAPKLLNSSVDKLDECKIHTRRQLRSKMKSI
jgi:hypothetical protein